MSAIKLVRIPSLRTIADFRKYIAELNIDLQADDQIETGSTAALAQPIQWGDRVIGNRWTVQPMEGWDGTTTGGVSEAMCRRWRRFGESGAKLIWGGEAMAVREDGRANPNQLIINDSNKADIADLRTALIKAHAERHEKTSDLVIGFQLTHSGRFCRPYDKKNLAPRIAYRHPILDRKFGITSDAPLLSDDDVKRIIDCYIAGAKISADIGADFVDIKHCHGYLLHEFLSAHTRPGPYGGSLENRTRVLQEIVDGIRSVAPGLGIGVRVSIFDFVPFKPDPALSSPGKLGPGIPESYAEHLPYRYGFGTRASDPVEYDLTEAIAFLHILEDLKIQLVNISAGSPYYNPHIQRPAAYPPSDGYQPPEDPLVGCARQINVVRTLKSQFPNLIFVGSAYSYLQEYLPNVAQYYVRNGHVDSVGLGRVVLSYPEIIADAVAGKPLDRRHISRTFSDCTTAPRNGLPSGCYPLDEYYKNTPEAEKVKAIKNPVKA